MVRMDTIPGKESGGGPRPSSSYQRKLLWPRMLGSRFLWHLGPMYGVSGTIAEGLMNGASALLQIMHRQQCFSSTDFLSFKIQAYHASRHDATCCSAAPHWGSSCSATLGAFMQPAFKDQFPDWIRLKPRVNKNWSQTLQTMEGHSDYVRSVAFSPDGTLIASASWDGTVRLWRAATGECVQTLEGHSGPVKPAAFSPDGTLIASASEDETVRLWCAATGEFVQTLEGHSESVQSAAFSPDGTLIASASWDRTVRLWRAATGECLQTLEGHSGPVNLAAFSPDSTLLASASDDRTVRLWRAATAECVQTEELGFISANMSFDPDRKYLRTDKGTITIRGKINADSSTLLEPSTEAISRSGVGISPLPSWVTWNGENMLRLPKDFIFSCSAVLGNTVVIGSASGRVIVMKSA